MEASLLGIERVFGHLFIHYHQSTTNPPFTAVLSSLPTIITVPHHSFVAGHAWSVGRSEDEEEGRTKKAAYAPSVVFVSCAGPRKARNRRFRGNSAMALGR